MKDVVKDRVHQYLFNFYSSKDSDLLLSELKKLAIMKDDNFKIDIFYIKRILKERGLSKEVDQIYFDIVYNKFIHRINFSEMAKRYQPILFENNRRMVIFSFGGSFIFFILIYLLPEDWKIVNGVIFIVGLIPILYTLWILLEPLLTCFILPLIQSILKIPLAILELSADAINTISGDLKRFSIFHDGYKDKPLIEQNKNLSPLSIQLIETLFEKSPLTEAQAQLYLNSLLGVKNSMSDKLL